MTKHRSAHLGPVLWILVAAGCGTSQHSFFHADVLAPRPMDETEQNELRSLGRLVSAGSVGHSILSFVPLSETQPLDSLVREAVAQVPGAAAIIDAYVEFGDVVLGPLALVYFNQYLRVSGTAAGPAPEASR